ncbi:TrkA family potassium uptake protein [Virgibacillus sp. SK37]|uniref:potassium channel family protein n=1 Tax=Virgibacillus sp. SK37 TaxID=403957 RepID=UPI0004D1738F|nr:potassium channel family protein [Virgibacillus sp. SK37]AIF44008.1 potassium channel protein [Virgibacillus sp. SK37]
MSIRLVRQLYLRIPLLIRVLLSVLFLLFLFGLVIHIIEPAQFPTLFDGIWWAIVTGATVGYGDLVPMSVPGKLLAMLLILSGGGLIAFYITSFSASTLRHEQDLTTGKIAFKGNNHIIIIGWNERTRQIIEHITKRNAYQEIVLIDQTLDYLNYKDYPVHFLHGNPTEDNTLRKANITTAKCVLISSDFSDDEKKADNSTILTIVTVRGNNPKIPIISEILSKIQIENALRAGANTIIRSNDFMSALFYHELYHANNATPFEDIIRLLASQQFCHIPLSETDIGKTFKSVLLDYNAERHILIGVIRNNEYLMNPAPDFLLQKEDLLISLTFWDN